jgi:hypothetical protein
MNSTTFLEAVFLCDRLQYHWRETYHKTQVASTRENPVSEIIDLEKLCRQEQRSWIRDEAPAAPSATA